MTLSLLRNPAAGRDATPAPGHCEITHLEIGTLASNRGNEAEDLRDEVLASPERGARPETQQDT
jgi:hypothetical protein